MAAFLFGPRLELTLAPHAIGRGKKSQRSPHEHEEHGPEAVVGALRSLADRVAGVHVMSASQSLSNRQDTHPPALILQVGDRGRGGEVLPDDPIPPVQGEIVSPQRSAAKGWRGGRWGGCLGLSGGVVSRGGIVAVVGVPVLGIGFHEDDGVGRGGCRREGRRGDRL
jgi:hypothetical protein